MQDYLWNEAWVQACSQSWTRVVICCSDTNTRHTPEEESPHVYTPLRGLGVGPDGDGLVGPEDEGGAGSLLDIEGSDGSLTGGRRV